MGAGNRLTGFTTTNTIATYTYNADSIRTSKTVNGVTTTYILNGATILTLKKGTDRMDFYYDESGNLLGFQYNNADYYYIKNVQGDIIGIIDANGNGKLGNLHIQIAKSAWDYLMKLLK